MNTTPSTTPSPNSKKPPAKPRPPANTEQQTNPKPKLGAKKPPLKWVALAVVGVLIAILAGIIVWFFATLTATDATRPVNGKIFVVSSGEGIDAIAQNLAQEGLIANALVFRVYATFGPARAQLKSGSYLIRPTSSIASIVGDMSAGKTATNTITYPEGITIRDMAERFEKAGYGTAESYIAATKSEAKNHSFIPPEFYTNPEGYLFPATYSFAAQSPASVLVAKQYDAFEAKILPIISRPRPGGLTPHQILTLASIVEKEALTLEDRRLVAGVFLNRLRLGMKLESDVTVNYATGKKITVPADLRVNSPYNTYLAKALPPTPICNPSLESVEATMQPTPNDYIFFLAGLDGKVYYAKTLQEHNQNIKNHL